MPQLSYESKAVKRFSCDVDYIFMTTRDIVAFCAEGISCYVDQGAMSGKRIGITCFSSLEYNAIL